jgi:hypothetical protein
MAIRQPVKTPCNQHPAMLTKGKVKRKGLLRTLNIDEFCEILQEFLRTDVSPFGRRGRDWEIDYMQDAVLSTANA